MTRISTLLGLCLAAPSIALSQEDAPVQEPSALEPIAEELQNAGESALQSNDETLVIEAADAAAQELSEAEEAIEELAESAEEAAALEALEADVAELEEASRELSDEHEARQAGTIGDALRNGRSWANLRYRFEAAEVRGFPKRSWASTARVAAGYETGSYEGFQLFVEGEGVTPVLSDDYNDGTGSRADQAPVFDPETLEFNQAFLRYRMADSPLEVRAGRQEIALANERFVGADPWRQNHQSFDALRAKYRTESGLELDYTFAFKVHRVFSNSSPFGNEDIQSHWLDASYDFDEWGQLGAFAYLNDFNDQAALSSNTLGARWSLDRDLGEGVTGDLRLEYAQQTDAYDNPIDLDADYWLARLGARRGRGMIGLAMEQLGGSGNPGDSFQTPFASVQNFNGFADQFRRTPDAGLVDSRLELGYDFDVTGWDLPVALRATYHFFESDAGDFDYGRELDLDVAVSLTDRLTVGARYADFNGDEIFRNANRASAWVSYRILE